MGSHEGPKTFISKRTPRETGSKAERKKEDNRKEKFRCKTEKEDPITGYRIQFLYVW